MESSRLGSAREEAERLVVTGLAVASTALRGMEANRQLRGLAEQVLGSDRMHDLAAGLAGFVNGLGRHEDDGPAGDPSAGPAPDPSTGPSADPFAGPAPDPFAGPSQAGSAGPAGGWATGSADCCVCPVCRLISALRDPSPEFAERLASAAGDLAVGISGLLRALSGAVPMPGHHAEHGSWRRGEPDAWHVATRATAPDRNEPDQGGPAATATTAAAYSTATTPAEGSAAAPTSAAKRATAKKAVAKKATAKKAVAKKATTTKATATEPVAKKATAKKAVAKKAVRKAVPRDPDDGPHER